MPAVILVVEYEWALRGTLSQALRAAGWHVLEAGSGEAAIGLLYACMKPISAVITGIPLKGMLTGWDVAEAVREKHPAAQVIYAAGNSIECRRQVSGGVFIEKPYRVPDMVKAVTA